MKTVGARHLFPAGEKISKVSKTSDATWRAGGGAKLSAVGR